MAKYILSCCSTADLSKEHFDKIDVKYICFHYELDGVEHSDDLGQTMPFEEFYRKMTEGAATKTSQVNSDEYYDFWKPYLEQGYDILHLTLSSGISGSINSANIAREDLEEEFPDRKLYVVDSLGASSGYGLIMDKLAGMRDEGRSIDELHDWIEQHKLDLNHWFFSTDLTFYIRGGRISKTAGTVGTILGICPLLNMDNEGRLIPRSKIRGKKKVIQEIVKRMEENAQDGLDYSGKCYISQSACTVGFSWHFNKTAKTVTPSVVYMAGDRDKEIRLELDGKVEINYIGTTIGSHTGPGTVALFFWGKRRQG